MTENPAAPPDPATPPAPPDPIRDRIRSVLGSFLVPALIVAAHFAVFFLARLWLVLRYRGEDFSALGAGEIAWGFVRGLRFDASVIFLVIGGPVLLLMLPFRPMRGRLVRGVLGWFCFAVLILFAFVLGCDVVYFGYVHQHVGPEMGAPGEALEAVALTGAVRYLLPLLAFLAGAVGAFFSWRRLMRIPAPAAGDLVARTAIALLLGWLMVAGWKGAFRGRKVKTGDAFEGARVGGYIALNGPFTIIDSRDTKLLKADFYPWPDALKTAQEALFAPGEKPADPEYPLLRAPASTTAAPKPNVVLIMLESWDAIYTDVHRREMGLPPLGLTPRFDALSAEGVLFTRFYAAGNKSMHGMAALLAGFPTLPDSPYLGHGMERSALPFLGRLAKKEGYETLFIQSSRRTAFRNDTVSALAGFETYLGAEDVPPAEPVVGRGAVAGAAWDHEMFAEANRRLAAAKRPFLAFLYTATTHAPYQWPEKKWERGPERYQNSLGYADWALGRFFDDAKKAGYFDSTIFILTADHVGGPFPGVLRDRAALHHVPGLVLAPGLKPGLDRRVGGQLDVLPTIADLAGWSAPHSALGRSLFRDGPGRGAFCVQGNTLLLRVEDAGSLSHHLTGRGETWAYRDGADFDAIERRLLSICQVAATLQKKNRLYPAGGGW